MKSLGDGPTFGHTRVVHLPKVTPHIRRSDPNVARLYVVRKHRHQYTAIVPLDLLHLVVLLAALVAVQFGAGHQQQLLETGIVVAIPLTIIPRHTSFVGG